MRQKLVKCAFFVGASGGISTALIYNDVKWSGILKDRLSTLGLNKAPIRDENDFSNFSASIANGELETVASYINNGMPVDQPLNSNGVTPLMLAVRCGQLDVVTYLVEQGANCHLQLKDGSTALLFAAQHDRYQIVQFLVAQGCSVNIENDQGHTPIIAAILNRNKVVARFLIENGATLSITKKGITPLKVAASIGNLIIIKDLVIHGADVNERDTLTGVTALIAAVESNQVEIVNFLINNGADVNLRRSDSNESAIYLAAKIGDLKIVRRLLEVKQINLNEGPTTNAVTLLAFAKNYVDMQSRTADAESLIKLSKQMDAFVDFVNQQPDPNKIKVLPEDIAKLMGEAEIAELIRHKRAQSNSFLSNIGSKFFTEKMDSDKSTVEKKY